MQPQRYGDAWRPTCLSCLGSRRPLRGASRHPESAAVSQRTRSVWRDGHARRPRLQCCPHRQAILTRPATRAPRSDGSLEANSGSPCVPESEQPLPLDACGQVRTARPSACCAPGRRPRSRGPGARVSATPSGSSPATPCTRRTGGMPVCSPARCTECTGLHVGHAHTTHVSERGSCQRARESVGRRTHRHHRCCTPRTAAAGACR